MESGAYYAGMLAARMTAQVQPHMYTNFRNFPLLRGAAQNKCCLRAVTQR
jgi:hypothetical protein